MIPHNGYYLPKNTCFTIRNSAQLYNDTETISNLKIKSYVLIYTIATLKY